MKEGESTPTHVPTPSRGEIPWGRQHIQPHQKMNHDPGNTKLEEDTIQWGHHSCQKNSSNTFGSQIAINTTLLATQEFLCLLMAH